jgi:hypothetical protein
VRYRVPDRAFGHARERAQLRIRGAFRMCPNPQLGAPIGIVRSPAYERAHPLDYHGGDEGE